MTSQRLKGTAFAFLLAAGTLFGGSVLAADVQPQEQEQAEESIPLEEIGLFADIFGTIKNYYVDEVPSKDLIENAIRGMVEGLTLTRPISTSTPSRTWKSPRWANSAVSAWKSPRMRKACALSIN